MRRPIRFLLEALAGAIAAGLVLAAAIPLLHLVVNPMPRTLLQALTWTTLFACVLVATLRPGGSLRR